jgi:hypothetical protein
MNTSHPRLDLAIEDLEDLDAPFDVAHWAAGFASGLAAVAIGVAVAT